MIPWKGKYVLERDILLEILEGYRVGTWDFCILHTYWKRLILVDRIVNITKIHFKAFRG